MDPRVFVQSRNLMFKATNLYYLNNYSQQMVARELNISVSTVSRLLAKSTQNGIVKIEIDPMVEEIIHLEDKLKRLLMIKDVIVAPSDSHSPLNSRLAVALEGARYLQNIIDDDTKLGLGFGGTINQLIFYLNPCKKTNTSFVMLHGHLSTYEYQDDMKKAMQRISNVFGGHGYLLETDAYLTNQGAYDHAMKHRNVKDVFDLYEQLTISVCGLGALHPEKDSALLDPNTIECPEISKFLDKNIACGDIFLNFFDKNGQECKREDHVYNMSIPFDTYRKIPTKMIVVAGEKKADVVIAAKKGGLMDVLVVDKPLAEKIIYKIEEENSL